MEICTPSCDTCRLTHSNARIPQEKAPTSVDSLIVSSSIALPKWFTALPILIIMNAGHNISASSNF